MTKLLRIFVLGFIEVEVIVNGGGSIVYKPKKMLLFQGGGKLMQRDNKKDYSNIFSNSESTRALKFANELWSKIINDELFSRQKNDICDYVLYLFNKYDSAHFFGFTLKCGK